MATLQVTTKTKNDYLKNWLSQYGLDSSIIENYDSITITLTDEDIANIKNPTEAKTDVSLLGKMLKHGDNL